METEPIRANRSDYPAATNESIGHQLDRFVKERLEAIARRLPPDGAPLDDALGREISTLESLSDLRKEHLMNAAPRRDWGPIVMLLATGAVITVLVFVPLSSVRAEMDILCSGVTFRTEHAVRLTGLSSLKLLQGVALAATQVEEPVDLKTIDLKPPLELRPREARSLTLGSITIPAHASVAIEQTGDPGTWSLRIASPEAIVAATLAGPVDVTSANGGPRTVNFGHGARVTLQAEQTSEPMLEIQITPSDVGSLLVRRTIP